MSASLLPEALAASPGQLFVEASPSGLVAYLREDAFRLQHYPRPCVIELKLPSWEEPAAIAAALLLRIARRDDMTHRHWIDGGAARGLILLKQLAAREQIELQLVTDRVERVIRTANAVRSEAQRLVEQIAARPLAWDAAAFDGVRRRVESEHATAQKLWTAGRAAARGRG